MADLIRSAPTDIVTVLSLSLSLCMYVALFLFLCGSERKEVFEVVLLIFLSRIDLTFNLSYQGVSVTSCNPISLTHFEFELVRFGSLS